MPGLFETEARLQLALELLDEAADRPAEEVTRAQEIAREYVLAASEKRDGLAYWMRAQEETEEAIGREIDRLQELRKRKTKAREGLREMIVQVMESQNIKKLSGVLSTFTLVEGPGPLVIPKGLDPESSDPRFVRHRPASFDWDKVSLRAAAKAGIAPAGVVIAPGKTTLRIGPVRRASKADEVEE